MDIQLGKKLIKHVGLIGTILTSIVYVLTLLILIIGFKREAKEIAETLIFSGVNAIVGIGISSFMSLEGISLAKDLPENVELRKKYYNTKTKDKKPHTMRYFWITSTIKNIVLKGGSLGGACFAFISIMIEGSEDYGILLLGIAGLCLSISLGLLGVSGAYDFYNNNEVPRMKEQLGLLKEVVDSERNN